MVRGARTSDVWLKGGNREQLCGNLFSALLVPAAERAATLNFALPAIGGTTVALQGDSLLLGAITFAALLYFSTFDAPLKRAALDCATRRRLIGHGARVVYRKRQALVRPRVALAWRGPQSMPQPADGVDRRGLDGFGGGAADEPE